MAQRRNGRVGAVDFLRALSTLIIMGFHFWQQSWLQGIFPEDLLRPIGVQYFSLTWVPRTGYMFLDVLLLLSGFCLFLPYARHMTDPLAPEPDRLSVYFKKRAARILPCYYLSIAVYLIFFARPADYGGMGGYLRDLLAHLTCTQVFTRETYFYSHLCPVIWTLSVEVQFYVIFPLLARVFRRYPLAVWAAMSLGAEVYLSLFARLPDGTAESFCINQLPAFGGVYANGMMAALFYCVLLRQKRPKRAPLLALGICVFCWTAAVCMLQDGLNRAEAIERWQVDFRFPFSVNAALFLVALEFTPGAVRALFSNPAVRFVSLISYNLYLWHFTVMDQLRE